MFAAELPLPVVRELITKTLADAGTNVPADGMMILRTYQPTKERPEGFVRVEVSQPYDGRKPAKAAE